MKVVAFAGLSGAGKTTLLERLIPALKQSGLRVSVLKHAHHTFDVDQPGKDSYRHRQAGAEEVMLASDLRFALMHEHNTPTALTPQDLIAKMSQDVDWLLVEGFKDSPLPKIEIWRAPTADWSGRPLRFPHDPWVVAVAADSALPEPVPASIAVLDLNDAPGLAKWLLGHAKQFEYPAILAAPARTQPLK